MKRFAFPFLPLLLTWGALSAGCKANPTGLHVNVTFDATDATSIAQLEFAVLSGDRQTTLVPFTPRPQDPGRALTSPQDVVIYLPEVTQTVVCQVRVVGSPSIGGEQTVVVSPNQLSDVRIDLGVVGPPDGGADGATADADAGGETSPADASDGATETSVGGLDDGHPCADARECASGYCADGYCCNSSCVGTCRACNIPGDLGACTAVAVGQPATADDCAVQDPSTCGLNGKCDGTGACQKYTTGTTCKAATCDQAGVRLISASQCDGAGTCVAGQTIPCDPFVCDTVFKKCFTQCLSNSQCMPGQACNVQNTCGKKPNGASCTAAADCFTGQCVDGICCASACSGSCVSCSQAGKEGLCSPLPAGVLDPRGVCRDTGVTTCGTNGLCNGLGGCQRYAAGSICAPRRCGAQRGQEVAARTCDGNGTCGGGATTTCAANFACNPATNTCFSGICTTNSQCVAECRAGRCRN